MTSIKARGSFGESRLGALAAAVVPLEAAARVYK
jgi:hypothetical protein